MSDYQGSPPVPNNAFQFVPGPNLQHHPFPLSHEKKMTVDPGQLVPFVCVEANPGERFKFAVNCVLRTQPLLAPIYGELNAWFHLFFVATRNLWPKIDETGNNWESFITGGVDGLNAAVAPRWNVGSGNHDVGSLWDFFGLPTWSAANTFAAQFPDAVVPLAFPLYAYNQVWNEWFRSQTLQTPVALTSEAIQTRNWEADFFTRALPWQQRGTAPALPVSGSTSAVWAAAQFGSGNPATPVALVAEGANQTSPQILTPTDADAAVNVRNTFNTNTVSLASATTFGVNDIRLAVLIQRQLEVRGRGGVRYTEFLQAVYGTHPRDDRLNRPEFIGGYRMPILVSEVLQTSAAAAQPTPQGNLAGRGISAGEGYLGSYRAPEHGYFIGLMSVMPRPAYQQGIDASWLRTSKYDWLIPEFQGLSEQAVYNQELYLANDGLNRTIFGYQARYNEYRYQRSLVTGLFRSTLNYWHLGRVFSSRPSLNDSFISLKSAEATTLKRVAAVTSQPMFFVNIGNVIEAVRPISEFGEPGLRRI